MQGENVFLGRWFCVVAFIFCSSGVWSAVGSDEDGFIRLGTLKPRETADSQDDQWMIGCEVLDRDFTKFSSYKDYLPKLGIRSIRLQGGWAKCEKEKGKYDFAWLDEPVDFALAHGLNPVLETDYGNPIYEGGGTPDLAGGFPVSEEALAAWDRWVDALSKHFKGRVRDWAMWNEPDFCKEGTRTPQQIVAFNVRTAKTILKNIPDARIAGLSLASNEPAFNEACYKAFGEDIRLFWRFIYHGYATAPEESYPNVEKLKSLCAKYAPHATLWQGENGAPSEMPGDGLALNHIAWSEISQAKWDMRRMLGDYVRGIPSSVFTICDYYHPGFGIGSKGLLRADSARNVIGVKRAFGAVRNVVSIFDSEVLRVARKVSSSESSLQLWEFQRRGAPLFVFWTAGEWTNASGKWRMAYKRPGDSMEKRSIVFRWPGKPLKEPVWVDLLTGKVYAFPRDRMISCTDGLVFTDVPVYDSPCLITERTAMDISPAAGDDKCCRDLTRYVLPLMGSDSTYEFSTGNTYPAVGRPNGMHLWTLQTGKNGSGWIYGYRDHTVRGVRLTHAPSPWINDHCAWSFMPLVRDAIGEESRASWFSHKEEMFEPHRMKVYLAEDGVTVELTATERAALARVVYPATDTPYFVVDAFGGGDSVRLDPAARRIEGKSGFSFFVLEFDRDFAPACGEGENPTRIKFAPMKRGETVMVRIASSFVSHEQALRNLAELGDGDFVRLAGEGRRAWNARLGRIRVEGKNIDDLRKFYTCLYRTQLFPLTLHEYGADGEAIHRNPETGRIEKGVYYAGTGFWDTFRALFPLLNFVYSDVNAKMTEGLRNCWRECGWLPEWSSPGFRNCMIGNNSASVVADACLTPGVVSREMAEELYAALLHGANAVKKGNDSCGRAGWELYNRLGYVPRDAGIRYSAARTLEYAYNDWCIWRLGVALGRPKEETDVYLKRSGNWRNVFYPSYKLMCGRGADGTFDSAFDPFDWGGDFIEGCSWHYTWSVFHDVAGLAEAMGGKSELAAVLDKVFELPPVFRGYGGQVIHEMREMQVMNFGQYAHGNQPIQHMIYLYNWTDEPQKAQYWVREAMERLYKPAPDGYCGDEDNGQTSAWFVWSALGMYPVCPASGEYALGAPLFEKATISFPDGKELLITAPGVSSESRYVRRVAQNGNVTDGRFVKFANLRKGGVLTFEMSAEPERGKTLTGVSNCKFK